MGTITSFVVVWLVTSVSLYILSKLPTGVVVNGFGSALVAGFVLGLLNAILLPVLEFFSAPFIWITFGLFSLLLNGLVFMIAASLVKGFSLNRGCLTAIVGALLVSLLNGAILWLVNFM